jgi:hypothetical protein
MPGTLGKVTPSDRPSRRYSSRRLSPNALTLMSTQPADGTGTGTSRMARADGGPGASRTTARMVAGVEAVCSVLSAGFVEMDMT